MQTLSIELAPNETQWGIFQKVFAQAFNFRREYWQVKMEALAADESFDREDFIQGWKEEAKENYGRINVSIFDAEAEMLDKGIAPPLVGFHAAFHLGMQVNEDSIWLPFFRLIKTVKPIPDQAFVHPIKYVVVWMDEEKTIWANLYQEVDNGSKESKDD